MNQIKKCSIAGVSFTMETDAYEALSAYIESLKDNYKNDPDGEEIVADIEARIAELILSAQPSNGIVCKPLISNIIKQMGSAEEIDNESTDYEQPKREPEKSDINGNPRMPRRLYRDMENGKLGGVCAGIANYFDKDVTLIRLLMFVPLMLSVISGPLGAFRWFEPMMYNISFIELICYLVMWFTVPVASSARQKLEMRGEKITAESIKNNIATAPDIKERSIIAKLVGAVGTILLIILKIIAFVILIGLVVGGSILGLVALNAMPMLGFEFYTGLALLSFFFVATLPILILMYLVIMFLLARRPKGMLLLVMLLLWIVSITSMTISAIKSPIKFNKSISNAFASVFNHNDMVLYKGFDEDKVKEYVDLKSAGMSSTTYKVGEYIVSSNHKPELLAMFLGKEADVTAAKESLVLDIEKKTISFRTAKGTPVKVTVHEIDCPEGAFESVKPEVSTPNAQYTFTVDNELMVYCAIGPNAKEDNADEEFIKEVFKADEAGNIVGKIFNLPSDAIRAAGRIATESSESAKKAHEKALKQHEKQMDKAKEQIEEAKENIEDAKKRIEEAKREYGTEGVEKLKNYFSVGDEYAVSIYKNDMHIMLCGKERNVKNCEASVMFEKDYLTFISPKGKKVKASADGIEVDGKTYQGSLSKGTYYKNGKPTTTCSFTIDGLKIQFQQGPDIDMTKVTKELVMEVFGATSKIFGAAGSIFKAAGEVISTAADVTNNINVSGGIHYKRPKNTDIYDDILEQAKLSEPNKGATTATKTGTESWATNPKVYNYPINGKVVKGYSHDGVYVLFYGTDKDVDCCIRHFAIDENDYVQTTTRKGSKILITRYGIKVLFENNETDAVKIDKYMKLKTESEYGDQYLLTGKVDDVEYRYYVGNSDSPVTKEDIAKISNTAYVQGLFPQMKE